MILYTLKCSEGHAFDSWFQSASAFEKLKAAGHVCCAVCGTTKVEKAVMAPRVSAKSNKAEAPAQPPAPLSTPQNPMEKAVAELRAQVEANSENVGDRFAAEARKIHDGDAESRAIHGEATLADAKSLIDDGVPVAPLPFMSRRND